MEIFAKIDKGCNFLYKGSIEGQTYFKNLAVSLMIDTERAFPIKQKQFSVLAKKAQHLFLTTAAPINK